MSTRRRRRAPLWPRIAALGVAAAVAVLLIVLLVRLFNGALGIARGGDGLDPQFAEPVETVTRPPELLEDGQWPPMEEDPSDNWDLGEQTPVDKTADELSREAAEGR